MNFYPLTVAKSLWYDEKVAEFELGGQMADLFLIWLLTLPNDSGVLEEYAERGRAVRSVRQLSRRLHCTTADLTDVVKKCVPRGEGGDGDAQYGGVVALLLKEYGGTPEQWLFDTPVDMISELIEQFINAKNQELASADKGKAPMPTEKLRALKRFMDKSREIRGKWNG